MNDTICLQPILDHIQKDPFAAHLGAKVTILAPGHSRVSLVIQDHYTNFHGSTHGGVIFAISDMAFAAACNSHGRVAVALNVSICFLKPTYAGDLIVAEAKEVYQGGRTSLYTIEIFKEKTGELVAKSQDQAYIKDQLLVPPPAG